MARRKIVEEREMDHPNTLSPAERVLWAAGIPRKKWHGIFEVASKGVVPFEAIVRLMQLDQYRETLQAIEAMGDSTTGAGEDLTTPGK